ncbi:hypothetical protein, partial [Microcoleus sp.]|uniref:hypothetical protein n=1 Tax=Microcoleus sp. TaxID=44472 RepID=UPI00403EA111
MKNLFYSFVIVSVVLLALFTISQLSTAQDKSEATTEIEDQKGLQETNLAHGQLSDNIWTQIPKGERIKQIIESPVFKEFDGWVRGYLDGSLSNDSEQLKQG